MDIIQQYFPETEKEKLEKLTALRMLYEEWNDKINVISRKDMEHFTERHLLHSLGIAKVIQFKPGTRILDVGTGGGFPGIPLAIMFPEAHFTLVDSIGKKIKVVQEVSKALNLKNISAQHQRAEKIPGQFDFIVSRAVTALPRFLPWVNGKVAPKNINTLINGILYLKGGDIEEELAQIKKDCDIYHLNTYFKEDFFETKMVLHIY